MAGRRASYLNPIRMYVFTSAFFFIILFSLKKPEDMVREDSGNQTVRLQGLPELIKKKAGKEAQLAKTKDEDDKDDLQTSIGRLNMEIGVIQKHYGDTTTLKFDDKQLTGFMVEALGDSLQEAGMPPATKRKISEAIRAANNPESGTDLFGLNEHKFKSVAAYDSVERALPDSMRDGWLKRWGMRKVIIIQEERARDKQRFNERLMENLFHSFPKILFWSLPIFALILNVLYFRHKQYFYVDHGIFTIHVYIATFILMLLVMLLNRLEAALDWGWFNVVGDILIFGLSVYMLIYLYKAMRGFYKQRRAKTFVKYFIVCSLSFFINLILLVIFFFISLISA